MRQSRFRPVAATTWPLRSAVVTPPPTSGAPKKRSWNPANEVTEGDLVERRFVASCPEELWLTYLTPNE